MKATIGKVKECPFCGGKPKLIELNKYGGFSGRVFDYAVRCSGCRTTTATYHTIEDARQAWNRRKGADGDG